jgi:hypothetical protein
VVQGSSGCCSSRDGDAVPLARQRRQRSRQAQHTRVALGEGGACDLRGHMRRHGREGKPPRLARAGQAAEGLAAGWWGQLPELPTHRGGHRRVGKEGVEVVGAALARAPR